jgi:hypothetical protein
MRTVGVLLLAVLAFVGVALSTLFYLDYLERPRSYFSTFAEMEGAGMLAAGWLPEFLPRSAVEIQEGHDVDTNEVWASFKYQVGDNGAVEAACEVIASNDRAAKYLCPPLDARTSIVILGRDGTAHYFSYAHGI